ncbi:MAG: helix-turn-helix transcriptional regulator [Deltaproteobacteria bacterium]|nr:helix-turn-helix transcriptional regulator [Deltaproteobacteria bacterium]
MRPTSTVQEFLSDPYGRYFCGRQHIVFAHSHELIGFVCWGYPDVDDVREMLTLCEIGVRADARPHRFLVDVRELEFVDPRTFAMFVDYTRRHRDVLGRKLMRQALLRPEGLVGSIISGFSNVAKLSYPYKVFAEVDATVAWLGLEPGEGADLVAELEAVRANASGTNSTVRRMREVLATTRCATLAELAQRLKLSRRTCQRALNDAGTTFRRELRAARLTRARDFLQQSDRNLTWIAAELGFSSAQHFATAFRKATGETPSAWRARHRSPSEPHRKSG